MLGQNKLDTMTLVKRREKHKPPLVHKLLVVSVIVALFSGLFAVFTPAHPVFADVVCKDGFVVPDTRASDCDTDNHGGVKPASTITGTSGTGATTDEKNCYNAGVSLGWIMCPILDLIDRTLSSLKDHIQSVLEIKGTELGIDASNKYQGTRKAWQNFSRLSTVLIVIATLIMIISTALSIGPLDNYTIKKMLPRLLFAIVFIQLSWVLLTALIRVSNAFGAGIEGIIVNAFGIPDGTRAINVLQFEGTGGNVVGFLGLAGIAGAALGLIAILPIALSAFLGFLLAFIVLTFRKVIVIALLVISPVAIAMRAVPGLEQWYKKWWDLFSRALLMYPLIMLFLSIGAVFANIFISSGSKDDPASSGNKILAIVCYFGPYFLIPLTFKFAGGLIGQLSGAINDRNKGFIDKAKEKSAAKVREKRNISAAGQRFSGNNIFSRAGNLAARGLVNPVSYAPGKYGAKQRAIGEERFNREIGADIKRAKDEGRLDDNTASYVVMFGNARTEEARNRAVQREETRYAQMDAQERAMTASGDLAGAQAMRTRMGAQQELMTDMRKMNSEIGSGKTRVNMNQVERYGTSTHGRAAMVDFLGKENGRAKVSHVAALQNILDQGGVAGPRMAGGLAPISTMGVNLTRAIGTDAAMTTAGKGTPHMRGIDIDGSGNVAYNVQAAADSLRTLATPQMMETKRFNDAEFGPLFDIAIGEADAADSALQATLGANHREKFEAIRTGRPVAIPGAPPGTALIPPAMSYDDLVGSLAGPGATPQQLDATRQRLQFFDLMGEFDRLSLSANPGGVVGAGGGQTNFSVENAQWLQRRLRNNPNPARRYPGA